jgi:hypothetical protein
MAKKNHPPAPVPPGNRPQAGPLGVQDETQESQSGTPETEGGAPLQEQDPKRRLGNYGGAGEHPYQQPGGRNDADR